MVKSLRTVCLTLLLWLATFGVQAQCSYDQGVTSVVQKSLSFGNVVVTRDAAEGSVIATAETGSYNNGNSLAFCDSAAYFAVQPTKWTTPGSSGQNVYNTNIPGVGIRLSINDNPIPYYLTTTSLMRIIIRNIKAELIKTGPVTGGVLDNGHLAIAYDSRGPLDIARVSLEGTNTIVNETSCRVTTPNIEVNLNEHRKSDFSGPGTGTDWVPFSIGLYCSNTALIRVRIDAVADKDAGVPGVIKLDSVQDGASGVGVQLWYSNENTPVLFGQDYSRQSSGGDDLIKLKARYYQTQGNIKGGKANATATFTLSYK